MPWEEGQDGGGSSMEEGEDVGFEEVKGRNKCPFFPPQSGPHWAPGRAWPRAAASETGNALVFVGISH